MSSAARAALHFIPQRSIRILVQPMPITFAERRAVLQVLEQHGPVEVFKMTPGYASNFVSVTKQSTTAETLVACSPLTYSVPVTRADPDLYLADLTKPASLQSEPLDVKNGQDHGRSESSPETAADNARQDSREFTLEIFPIPDYEHRFSTSGSALHGSWPQLYENDRSFMAATLKQSLPKTIAAKGLAHWLFDLSNASTMEGKSKRLQLKGWLPSRMKELSQAEPPSRGCMNQ